MATAGKFQTEDPKILCALITPRSRVLLAKLIKKFPPFYGTRRFITAFTAARNLSLSWASSIQSIPPHPTSWRSILILSSHLRWVSQVVSFLQVSPVKTTHTPLLSPTCDTCPAHLILDFIGVPSYKIWSPRAPGARDLFTSDLWYKMHDQNPLSFN